MHIYRGGEVEVIVPASGMASASQGDFNPPAIFPHLRPRLRIKIGKYKKWSLFY